MQWQSVDNTSLHPAQSKLQTTLSPRMMEEPTLWPFLWSLPWDPISLTSYQTTHSVMNKDISTVCSRSVPLGVMAWKNDNKNARCGNKSHCSWNYRKRSLAPQMDELPWFRPVLQLDTWRLHRLFQEYSSKAVQARSLTIDRHCICCMKYVCWWTR